MAENHKHLELVQKAQQGCKTSLDQLAADAAVRLRVHVYRLTLCDDLTQDIVQESILEMIRIIDSLKAADKFWPWLYGIAQNKLHRYWRSEKKNDPKRIEQAGFGGVDEDSREGLENLLADELRQSVGKAMGSIKPRHRQILSMRCYDEMSYSEISDVLGCSKFAAQMLFCRAKRSLAKQLSKQGLGRGSVIMALVIFGKMTSESSAAAGCVSVTTASLGASAAAMGVCIATSLKTAVVTTAAVGLIAAGTSINTGENDNVMEYSGKDIKPLVSVPVGETEDSKHQFWYYFPDGPGNAIMMRRIEEDPGGNTYCSLLQNQHANYQYNKSDHTIMINNNNWYSPDLTVKRLPGDDPSLTAFISQIEGFSGNGKTIEYIPGNHKNLLVIANHDPDRQVDKASITRHKNALEEEYFQYPWALDIRKIDNRDQMHQRGWTYFRISGQIENRQIRGKGQVPFVYNASKVRPAWIDITVGETRIMDSENGSVILRNNTVCAYGQHEVLLNGMPRPWKGLHCIDSVRRDAASLRLPFETERINESVVKISIGLEGKRLIYNIDLNSDLINSIEINSKDLKGQVNFEYFQDVSGLGNQFSAPGRFALNGFNINNDTIWLWDLAKGTLAN